MTNLIAIAAAAHTTEHATNGSGGLLIGANMGSDFKFDLQQTGSDKQRRTE